MTAEELVLRPAGPGDLAAVGEVMIASRRAAFPAMPPAVHPDPEVRAFVAGWDLDERVVWVGLVEERVVGFAAVLADWLDFLFVLPDAVGQGVGSALLDVVKSLRPGGFGLWVFASNAPARAFYARHGLAEREHTDGADNEEHAPDLRMTWPGRTIPRRHAAAGPARPAPAPRPGPRRAGPR